MIIRMIMAGVLVLAAGGLGVAFLSSRPPPPAPVSVAVEEAPRPEPVVVATVAKKPMLVAARPLSAGTLVKDEDFVVREVASEAVPEGALLESEEVRVEIRGALLRRYLDAGRRWPAATSFAPAIAGSWPRCSAPAPAPSRSASTR